MLKNKILKKSILILLAIAMVLPTTPTAFASDVSYMSSTDDSDTVQNNIQLESNLENYEKDDEEFALNALVR